MIYLDFIYFSDLNKNKKKSHKEVVVIFGHNYKSLTLCEGQNLNIIYKIKLNLNFIIHKIYHTTFKTLKTIKLNKLLTTYVYYEIYYVIT